MLLTWQRSPVTGIAGYRIYRASASGGPYELIGVAAGALFEDWVRPQLHQPDYYVVEAFDQAGVRSEHSVEAVARPWAGQQVFLPMMRIR